jgi:hypothetical protein
MKRYLLLVLTCILTLVLTSCAQNPTTYRAQISPDLVQETWLGRMNLDPNVWTRHADRWFFTGEPHTFDEYASRAPLAANITAMTVRVPDFTNIVVSGPYKIQIYGRQMHSSVFVLGTNEAARHVSVEVRDNTLFVHPATDCSRNGCGGGDVIVRIGLSALNSLIANGNGPVEGKDITSNALTITSNTPNEILLTGNMNVQRIIQNGMGTTSVIGVYAPCMDIMVPHNGNVNVSGHIGIRRISKAGNGMINVIGADSDGLRIDSTGGITAIAGYANVKTINATQNGHIYLYWVASDGIYINVRDNARVGLAGAARNVDVEVSGNARYEGKYLRTDNIYVKTRGYSHANVFPQQKLFANASDFSSIYFFGTPNVISRYTTGHAIIVPIFNDGCPVMPRMPKNCPVRSYKDESYKGETSYKGDGSYSNRSYQSTSTTYHKPSPYAYRWRGQ